MQIIFNNYFFLPEIDLPLGMEIVIKNSPHGYSKVDVPLYNRGDCMGIDFNGSKSQILIEKITAAQARQMIRELEDYIAGLKPKQG